MTMDMIRRNMRRHRAEERVARIAFLLFLLLACLPVPATRAHAAFIPDSEYQNDQKALDELQRACFMYMWEDCEPNSGMAHEGDFSFGIRPIAVGGTGFGIAAIVVAADREWIGREQAVARLMQIAVFLRDKTPRKEMHGAFPHWLDGNTGAAVEFSEHDAGADIVETSFLMQGLLIARAYFNGPGVEEKLRNVITELWEEVEWDWFTNGEENGLYWHWDPVRGFYYGLRILGYNECLITYVLAASSPRHPISRRAYDYWTSGDNYQPREAYGYEIEASPPGGGPLFMAHYSFIGLDPRKIADAFVGRGYFVRGVNQTLANRGYCLYEAPVENKYADNFWGLTAACTKSGYAVSDPLNDHGTVAPTAALSSMPYTPRYSLQVLRNLLADMKKKAWGKYGPYDAASLRDDWVGDNYLAIDQLPMVCMVENYRSGLLWDLFMSDRDVGRGLSLAGLAPPTFREGFPEMVITLRKEGDRLVPDAHDICRHPDSGMYEIPYFAEAAGPVSFRLVEDGGDELLALEVNAVAGRNILSFAQFAPRDDAILTIVMKISDGEHTLPVRLH